MQKSLEYKKMIKEEKFSKSHEVFFEECLKYLNEFEMEIKNDRNQKC